MSRSTRNGIEPRRAADHDARIVSIGAQVFCSTDTGDAWILEPADGLACRLAIGGDPIAIPFDETETGYAIGWQGHYRIEGDLFTYEARASHRRIAIGGYPVHLLRRVVNEADLRNRHGLYSKISNLFG